MSVTIRPAFFNTGQAGGVENERILNSENDNERQFVLSTIRNHLGPDVQVKEQYNGLFKVAISFMEDIHTLRLVIERSKENVIMKFNIVEIVYDDALRADDAANTERYRLINIRRRQQQQMYNK